VASKVVRSTKKLKAKHRAVKPRPVRPLDAPKADNHAARHAAKKERRAKHEALMAKQAAEKAEREALEAAAPTEPLVAVQAPSITDTPGTC